MDKVAKKPMPSEPPELEESYGIHLRELDNDSAAVLIKALLPLLRAQTDACGFVEHVQHAFSLGNFGQIREAVLLISPAVGYVAKKAVDLLFDVIKGRIDAKQKTKIELVLYGPNGEVINFDLKNKHH